jgi:hypothetical protein
MKTASEWGLTNTPDMSSVGQAHEERDPGFSCSSRGFADLLQQLAKTTTGVLMNASAGLAQATAIAAPSKISIEVFIGSILGFR